MPSRANHRRFVSGLMMESEMKIFEMMNKKAGMSKYWMPLVWATNIINRARKEALITSDHVVQTLLVELSDIRKRLGALIGYDTVCVPLVYTQVSYSRGNDEFMRDRCTVYFIWNPHHPRMPVLETSQRMRSRNAYAGINNRVKGRSNKLIK